jgi:diadenosine tetraphosphate (Ap4A) HIT family hydrolase
VPTNNCPFCDVIAGLQASDVYRPRPETVYRKVAELPTAIAVLGNDQFYRGYTLVVARTHATELFHLPEDEATRYCADMMTVARAVADAFRPRKLNYELLGNTVAHLHWHVFPRYQDDPAPQRPVWEHPHPPRLLSDAEYSHIISALRAKL